MPPEQEKAITDCLLFFARLAAKRLGVEEVRGMAARAFEVIAAMERVLPACESGILRHLVIHLAKRAHTAGPPWTHAMWPWERLWGRLVQWLKQKRNPAVSVMKGFHAFELARLRWGVRRLLPPPSSLYPWDYACF